MAPTLTSQTSSTWTDTVATTEVTGTLTWNAGDRILVLGVTEDNPVTLNTPTATGLTFAAIGSALTGSSNAWAHAWEATAAGSGSQAVSSTVGGGSAMRGIWASAWGNCNGFVRTNSSVGTATDTVSVTRTQANSCIAYVGADWNAVGNTSPGWSPAGFTEIQSLAHANVSAFAAHWGDQGGAGTTAYGPAALTGTRKWVHIGIEVLEAAAAATPYRQAIYVAPGFAAHRGSNY